jgi:hypothetical protein
MISYKELKKLVLQEENYKLQEFYINQIIKNHKRNLDAITKNFIYKYELNKGYNEKLFFLKSNYLYGEGYIYIGVVYKCIDDDKDIRCDSYSDFFDITTFLNCKI